MTETASRSRAGKRGGGRKQGGSGRSRDGGGRTRGGGQPSAERRVRVHIDPERIRDLWGIGLVVVALLAALGLYSAGSAGLVGVALVNVFRGLLGIAGLAVPPLIAAGGVMLLGRPRASNPRIVLGAATMLLALLGLWHLVEGAPGPDATREVLHGAGGYVGMALALPLRAVAATPGAVVVLVGMLAAGVLIMTATSPRIALHAVTTVFLRPPGEGRPPRRRRLGTDVDGDDPAGPERDYVEDFGVGADVATIATGPVHDDTLVDADPVPLEQDPPASTAVFIDAASLMDTQDVQPPAEVVADADEEDEDPPVGAARKLVPRGDDSYTLPPLDLLRTGRAAVGNGRAMESMTMALERMLREFGVDATVVAVRRGPTVTRFEIELGVGVKVAAITKLEKDIAYALATPEIRIVAPIPGKVAIGIEVPNSERDHITLGDILRSPEARAATHPLTAAIGVDISGRPVLVNLAKMPHLLIAGATGSGKSVTMNGIVTSIVMRNAPEAVRMILIDPKRVEMATYEDIPHLLTRVVTDPKRAKDALDWVVAEMERRYELLARYGHRNLDRFNEAAVADELADVPLLEETDSDRDGSAREPLPYILCVIDELADLMMVAPRDIENAIVRIAQMARAVGIHLIIATQRPSVNVVTGLIKANVPSRIALSMATGHDSKTILDQHGAEKLIGNGDMLYLPANASKPHRLQGCFVDETEIEQIVTHCKSQAEVVYTENVVKEGQEAAIADVQMDDVSDDDLTRAAMELVVRSGLGSTSMLQRKLKIGFARAGRVMDELEEMGVVGPSEGPKARDVLMTVEELEARTGV